MDDLLTQAQRHDDISAEELGQQMWLTGFVIAGLFTIAVGIDFIGNGIPGFGHLLTSLGLAGLTYLSVEYGVRQHRRSRDLDHPGLTVLERVALIVGLTTIVVTAAL